MVVESSSEEEKEEEEEDVSESEKPSCSQAGGKETPMIKPGLFSEYDWENVFSYDLL